MQQPQCLRTLLLLGRRACWLHSQVLEQAGACGGLALHDVWQAAQTASLGPCDANSSRMLSTSAPLLARASKRVGKAPLADEIVLTDDYFLQAKPADTKSVHATKGAAQQQHGVQRQPQEPKVEGHTSRQKQRDQGQHEQRPNKSGARHDHAFGRLLAREFQDEGLHKQEGPQQDRPQQDRQQRDRPQQDRPQQDRLQQDRQQRDRPQQRDSSRAGSSPVPPSVKQQRSSGQVLFLDAASHTTPSRQLQQPSALESKYSEQGVAKRPGQEEASARAKQLWSQEFSSIKPAMAAAVAAAPFSSQQLQARGQHREDGTAAADASPPSAAPAEVAEAAAWAPKPVPSPSHTHSDRPASMQPAFTGTAWAEPKDQGGQSTTQGASRSSPALAQTQAQARAPTPTKRPAGTAGRPTPWRYNQAGRRQYDQAYDALLGSARHARQLPELLMALRQHMRRGMVPSPRGAAEAVSSGARLVGRGVTAASGADWGAVSDRQRSHFSSEVAELLSMLESGALPVLRHSCSSLPPQDLPPLMWGLVKLGLARDADFVQALLAELNAENYEAVRCRGINGVLMVAQGLCGLQSQGMLPSLSRKARQPVRALTQALAAAGKGQALTEGPSLQVLPAAASESAPDAEGQATGPLAPTQDTRLDLQGQAGGLDLQREGYTLQTQPEFEQHAELGLLAHRTLHGIGQLAVEFAGPMNLVQTACIASCLARLGHQNPGFYERAAAKALDQLDACSPFALSMLLRALAEAQAQAQVPLTQLLTAAEPVLLDGLVGGHFTPKGLKDVLYPYAMSKHSCPLLLPAIMEAAAAHATSGSISERDLRTLAAYAEQLGPLEPGLVDGL